MPEEQQDQQMSALFEAPHKEENQGSPGLTARIAQYERENGMTSDELLQKLAEGEVEEDNKISKWLFLLNVKGDHVTG